MTFHEWQDDKLLLKLRLQPRSKANAITGLHGDRLKLRVNAAATDNKANKEVIYYIANEFSVKQSDIELVSGLKHRDKKIVIKQPAHMPAWFNNLSDSTWRDLVLICD